MALTIRPRSRVVVCAALATLMLASPVAHSDVGTEDEQSAASPVPLDGIDVHRDVAYAGPSSDVTLDVYVPRAATPMPVLLFFHGGGWIGGDKADAIPEAGVGVRGLSPGRTWPSVLPFLRRGIAVVSVGYRLASIAPAPAAVEDAVRAVRWLGDRGRAYGIDPSHIVTIGPSAGGHLALMAAFTYRSGAFAPPLEAGATSPRVVGAIDLYGIADVAELLVAPRSRDWAIAWIPDQPGRSALARRVSPLQHVRRDVPPVLILHSRKDEVVPLDQSERLAESLRAAGVRVELVTFPDAPHGFFSKSELARVESAISDFLRELDLLPEVATPDGSGSAARPGKAP